MRLFRHSVNFLLSLTIFAFMPLPFADQAWAKTSAPQPSPAASAQPIQQDFLAVLDLDAKGGLGADEASLISDRLRANLLKTGKFRILERAKMTEILKEQGFQQSALCDTTSCSVELGRLLAVNRLITGNVGKVGNTYTMSVRMLDVEKGSIVQEEFLDCKDCQLDDVLTVITAKLAVKIAGQKGDVIVDTTNTLNNKNVSSDQLPTEIGILNLSTTPQGAEVFINGRKQGVTPLRKEVAPGDYTIMLAGVDFEQQILQVKVKPNEEVRREIMMQLTKVARYKAYKREERSWGLSLGLSFVPLLQLGYLSQGEWGWWAGIAGGGALLTFLGDLMTFQDNILLAGQVIGVGSLAASYIFGLIHSPILANQKNEELLKKLGLTPEDIKTMEANGEVIYFYADTPPNGIYLKTDNQVGLGFRQNF